MNSTTAPFGLPEIGGALADAIDADLDLVEKRIRAAVASEDAFVTEASRHLADAGGKRFRAILVLLAARLGDPSDPRVVPAAVVVELTHLATLYHDDVMDEAVLRRGERSANARWDNSIAILTGDYLFARASDIVADLGPEAVRLQARTFSRLVHGQIAETVGPREGCDPLGHYLDVLADKTGALIATSGRFGAMFAGADGAVVDAMTRACEPLGVAFQLSDDILDIVSDGGEFGKVPGTDLREGVPTLPVLHALRATDPAGARLRELLAGDLTDDARHAEALDLLRAAPAMAAARADLQHWAGVARAEIAALPAGETRDAFATMCDYVVNRTR